MNCATRELFRIVSARSQPGRLGLNRGAIACSFLSPLKGISVQITCVPLPA
jgi:hypothetical protein